MKCRKNHFLMQGLYPVGIAGSDSAGRVVQAPFGGNMTYNPSYYIMKMELAKGKRKRDGPIRVLYCPHRSNVSQGRNKKESRQLTLETLFHQVEHCPQQSNPKGSFQILRQIPSTAQHTVDFHSLYFIVDAVEHKILVNDHPTISRVKVVDLAHFRGIA